MPKRPRWLKRPVKITQTRDGFTFGGEGIIFKAMRNVNYFGDTTVYYLIMYRGMDNKPKLAMSDRQMTQDIVRANTEVQNEFSNGFKMGILEMIFSTSKTQNIDKFISILEDNPEIQEYF